jgi:hypothetical protein
MAIAKLTKAEKAELDKLLGEYASAQSALCDRLDEICSEWEEAIGDKSEKWQEGKDGEGPGPEAQARLDTVRAVFEEIPETPVIDFDSL